MSARWKTNAEAASAPERRPGRGPAAQGAAGGRGAATRPPKAQAG